MLTLIQQGKPRPRVVFSRCSRMINTGKRTTQGPKYHKVFGVSISQWLIFMGSMYTLYWSYGYDSMTEESKHYTMIVVLQKKSQQNGQGRSIVTNLLLDTLPETKQQTVPENRWIFRRFRKEISSSKHPWTQGLITLGSGSQLRLGIHTKHQRESPKGTGAKFQVTPLDPGFFMAISGWWTIIKNPMPPHGWCHNRWKVQVSLVFLGHRNL